MDVNSESPFSGSRDTLTDGSVQYAMSRQDLPEPTKKYLEEDDFVLKPCHERIGEVDSPGPDEILQMIYCMLGSIIANSCILSVIFYHDLLKGNYYRCV